MSARTPVVGLVVPAPGVDAVKPRIVTIKDGIVYIDGVATRRSDPALPVNVTFSMRRGGQRGTRGKR